MAIWLGILAAFPLAWMPSGGEWLVIAILGLLLFGKRLPEIGRSLGRGIYEFKRGLKDVEEEVSQHDQAPPDFDARPLAAAGLALLAGICILAALDEVSRRGFNDPAAILLLIAAAAGAGALVIRRS